LDNISRDALVKALEQRSVVRATLMRSTLHLVTARDYLSFQPALRGVLLRAFRGYFREEAGRIDIERLCLAASGYLSEEARTFPELRTYLSSKPTDMSGYTFLPYPLREKRATEGKEEADGIIPMLHQER
jgi:hypothetical protein